MTAEQLRRVSSAVLASCAIALTGGALTAAAAHAAPTGSSSGCVDKDGSNRMDDGEIDTWRGRYSRGSRTCTNGTICTSSGVKQPDGTTHWTYECHDAPIARRLPAGRPSRA